MKRLVMNTMVIITNENYWGIPGYMKWDGGIDCWVKSWKLLKVTTPAVWGILETP